MNLRQQQQQAFDRSGEPLIVTATSATARCHPKPSPHWAPIPLMWCRYTAQA